MPHVIWVHSGNDPQVSGELRRLALPALASEGGGWTSELVGRANAATAGTADVAVVAFDALDVLPILTRSSASIIVEIAADHEAVSTERLDALAAVSNRIAGVVARDPRAAAQTQRLVGPDVPIWLVPDSAARATELAAAALRFGLRQRQEEPLRFPGSFELWFAEPGDRIDPEEVVALARQWEPGQGRAVVIAPPETHSWLIQAGVKAECHDWTSTRLAVALSAAERCVFFGPSTYCQSRRVATARRSGASIAVEPAIGETAHDPSVVGSRWREVLRVAARPRPSIEEAGAVLMLLDLVQDLDLALPLIVELAGRPGVELRVVVSSWLRRRSPRVAVELAARHVPFETCDRAQIESGAGPSLDGVAAVAAIVESTLPAHRRAHVLFQRARALEIPTFSFQHGVENVGLVHMEFETSEPPTLESDHLYVWFGPAQVPQSAPLALRPRLVHVGRLAAGPAPTQDVRGALASFESIVAVFENLHWIRYSGAWRRQFLADCVDLANANPRRGVVLKPHHGGLWSVRNNHLLPDWPANLILADPTDPFWEPFTATSLIQLADLVITTPSTVALDAVQARKPVAIAAYGLELPAYAPLPLLQSVEDWLDFVAQKDSVAGAQRRAGFLSRTVVNQNAAVAAVHHMIAAACERAAFRRRDQPEPS